MKVTHFILAIFQYFLQTAVWDFAYTQNFLTGTCWSSLQVFCMLLCDSRSSNSYGAYKTEVAFIFYLFIFKNNIMSCSNIEEWFTFQSLNLPAVWLPTISCGTHPVSLRVAFLQRNTLWAEAVGFTKWIATSFTKVFDSSML